MGKIVFKNDCGHFVPKAMYWYGCQINKINVDNNLPLICLDAKMCNKLYRNELASFFEKYPDEIEKSFDYNLETLETNITDKEKKFYEKQFKKLIDDYHKSHYKDSKEISKEELEERHYKARKLILEINKEEIKKIDEMRKAQKGDE